MKINFDMDGTIANLYGVQNWLEMLIAEDTTPYAVARPMVNMSALARRLNTLQRAGCEIGVISWLSKSGGLEYNERVSEIKRKWLAKHLPSVAWDSVVIVPYGTPKELFCETAEDILFDDEERNRESWTGIAYDVQNILEILKEI